MGNVITDPAGNCVWCKLEKASCDIDPNACLICKVGGKLLWVLFYWFFILHF